MMLGMPTLLPRGSTAATGGSTGGGTDGGFRFAESKASVVGSSSAAAGVGASVGGGVGVGVGVGAQAQAIAIAKAKKPLAPSVFERYARAVMPPPMPPRPQHAPYPPPESEVKSAPHKFLPPPSLSRLSDPTPYPTQYDTIVPTLHLHNSRVVSE